MIVACMLLVGGSAAAFSRVQTKQYTASASLYFSQSQIGADVLGIDTTPPTATSAEIQADDVELVQSADVAARTAKALRNGMGAKAISNKVSVTGVGQSDFVTVAVTDHNPGFAARLANLYANQFITLRMQTERNAVLQVRNSLQDELNGMTRAERLSSTGASLSARIEQLNTLAAAQTGDVQLAQAATTPTSPSSPKTKTNVGLGLIIGLLLGFGIAVLLERLNRRVGSADELENIYGVPVLVEVPETRALGSAGRLRNGSGYEQNAFDMLRARLRYFPAQKLNTLLVTSSLDQEGKSTVAWHLAQATAISDAGAKVLLIDADMRRASIAASHGLVRAPGLSDVLSGLCDFSEALQVVPAGGLNGQGPSHAFDVLVAGPPPPNPSELIEGPQMAQLIQRATADYDMVVIDSAPALIVPDAIALSELVTGVLVVSHIGRLTRDDAVRLRNQLRELEAPVVGLVANRVKEPGRPAYQYDYAAPAAIGSPRAAAETRSRPIRSSSRSRP